jgi:hypothetical protein
VLGERGWASYDRIVREHQQPIRQADLHRWRLIERFGAMLSEEGGQDAGPSWSDPRRRLELGQYLGLYLLGLFNPVVTTMRGLCAASHLSRVQEEVCGRPVSLGSFSEAQAVVDPELLERVLARLRDEQTSPAIGPVASVIDSTVMRVVPRMSWALWRGGRGPESAVRLHVEFDLERGTVKQARVTPAKCCERAQWRRLAQPGTCYIGDRYYSYDYQLLRELQDKGVNFVVRLRIDTQWVQQSEAVLSELDRAAGVVWSGTVRLGSAGDGPTVRVVQIATEEETILLATTLSQQEAPAELIACLYRHRWEVELFFRWLKCILGARDWLAESERGVAIQVYLALIAAQLLVLYSGRRPNRRQMECIRFYLMGWATLDELVRCVGAGAGQSKKP